MFDLTQVERQLCMCLIFIRSVSKTGKQSFETASSPFLDGQEGKLITRASEKAGVRLSLQCTTEGLLSH